MFCCVFFQVSIPHKTDFDFNDISIPPNPKEPTLRRKYYIQSECSGMYVRIKIGRKRNSIDASGKRSGKYSKYILINNAILLVCLVPNMWSRNSSVAP